MGVGWHVRGSSNGQSSSMQSLKHLDTQPDVDYVTEEELVVPSKVLERHEELFAVPLME